MTTGEWIQIGVGIVLTLTLGAVLWYAWEARKQAKASARIAEEAREQRLITTRPILLLSPVAEEQGWDGDIARDLIRLALPGPLAEATPVRIVNVGTGIAVEVKVPCRLPGQNPAEAVIDYLPAGSHHMERNFYLAPKEGRGNQRVLKITYCDVFGNVYESTREFHKESGSQDYRFTPLRHQEVRRGGP